MRCDEHANHFSVPLLSLSKIYELVVSSFFFPLHCHQVFSSYQCVSLLVIFVLEILKVSSFLVYFEKVFIIEFIWAIRLIQFVSLSHKGCFFIF